MPKFLAGSIVLAFTALLGAEAATCTWKGAGDKTKWTDAANWEGGVPTGGDTACFSAAADISEDFAIGAGTLTIEVTGKDVYLRGVISGAGGVKKTGGGKLHLFNEANTYTGPTEISSGELWFKSLADIGQPSSLGAPSTEAALVRLSGTLYMENQSDANRVLTTDRPFEFRACTFRTSYQPVTVNLNGAITGTGVTWRGNGTINVASFIPATFTGNFGRTDNGVVNLLCPTNAFHTTGTTFVNLSDGAFRGTLADAGVPSGFGAGARFQLGQQNFDTTGRVYYNGPTSTNCNREIRIEVYTNGSYTVKRGGRLNNETPGTTIAFTGKLILNGNSKYAAHSAPMLWVGGEGNGVLTAPLIDNLSLEKDSTGTWTLTGASTTTGCVSVAQGRLDFDGSIVDGTGYDGPKVSVGRDAVLGGTGTVHCTVQMAMGAKLAPGHADAFGTLRFGPADVWFNPTSSFDVKIGAGTNDCIVSTGDVRANGDVTVNVVPMGVEEIPPGVYTLIQANTFTMPRFTLGPGAPLGSSLAVDAKSLRLIVPEASHRTLVWTGRAGETWDAATANWLEGEAEATFAAGDAVRFDDSSTVTNVTIAGAVEPFAVTVAATNANYTIGGEGIGGEEAQLVKSGPATLKLTGRQTFPLGAQVNEGKFVLDGTLDGSSLTVADGATFDQTAAGVISGQDLLLRFGFGSSYLRGTNTFTGRVQVDMRGGAGQKGEYALHLYGHKPLGDATDVELLGFGDSYDTCACLTLYPSTLVENVTYVVPQGGSNYRTYLRKQNVSGDSRPGCWHGDVRFETGSQCYIQCHGGVFELGRPGGENVIAGPGGFAFRGAGTIKAYSRIDIAGTIGRDDKGTVILYAQGNKYRNSNGVEGYYQLGVADGWCTNATLTLGKNNKTGMCGFNLDGFDQTLPGLNEANTSYACSTSQRRVWTPDGKPATLTIANDAADCAFGSSYGFSYIQGPLTLVKTGEKTFTLNGTNAFTGVTRVEAGVLRAAVPGALGGTTNVVVTGGTLRLGATAALNPAADLRIPVGSTGRIELDAGVEQVVQYLYLANDATPRAAGTYGSSQSAAHNKDDAHFSGTGVLVVRRGGGTLLLIR